MAAFDFVDLAAVDPTIVLDIRYATTHNVCNQAFYPSAKCFLRKAVAGKLVRVQKKLALKGVGLKVWDGYRPLSIQRRFFEIINDPHFVADPAIGSKHNRGAAVDVTLIDRLGRELKMPTEFDAFTEKAHRSYRDLPPRVLANRELLEQAMCEEGFEPLPHEWWHFNDSEWEKYPIEDISFQELEDLCAVH